MKLEINLNTFLIIVGFITLFWFSQCGRRPNAGAASHGDTTRTEITYRHDTTIYRTVTHNIYWHDTDRVQLPSVIDSPAVVRDYFTQREFSDSLIDTNIRASYSGMIWKNSLFDPKFEYKLLRPQAIINNTIIQPSVLRNKIFIGGFMSFNRTPAIGAILSFQNKRDRILTLGYGTGPTYLIGAQVKISFKKRE